MKRILFACMIGTVMIPKISKDIPYGTHNRQVMDIYSPHGDGPFPVIIFAHGGAWSSSGKESYQYIGRYFAQKGFICVPINYRVSPGVKHPVHAQDVAKAVAWVHGNISKNGFSGDLENLTLMGYSAGGHLVSLITLDEKYLANEGLSPSLIKNVVSISGIYAINHIVDRTAPDVFRREDWGSASPINQVREGCPPFLLVFAEMDLPFLGPLAHIFHDALVERGNKCEILKCDGRNHHSLIDLLPEQGGEEIISFIKG